MPDHTRGGLFVSEQAQRGAGRYRRRMGLADFLTRKPKPRSTAAPVRGVEVRATEVPAEPSTEPLAPREQTKVPAVRAAKVRAVPGARRRR